MRYAITGIAGFLGAHLARALIADGHEVCGMDIVHPSSADRLKGLPIEYHWGTPVSMVRRVKPVDAVIHAASVTNIGYAWANPEDSEDRMVPPTRALMEAMQVGWAKKIVLISTHSVYGKSLGSAFTEESPTRPMNYYGALKAMMENTVMAYGESFNLDYTILRMALMYGEWERDDATPRRFLEAALRGQTIRLEGGGKQTRDFNYVGNAVNAIRRTLDARVARGQIYNIGGGEDISIRHLAEAAITFAERGEIIDVPARSGEEGNIRLNYSKAQWDLGYAPEVRFEEGFKRAAEWVAQNEKERAE